MASILLTVSIRVSPFETDEEEAEKLTISALKRFWANSNEMRVRVEFSKKILATVISLREGTFLIGRLIMALKLSAVSNTNSISSEVISFIPSKCFLLNVFILFRFIDLLMLIYRESYYSINQQLSTYNYQLTSYY